MVSLFCIEINAGQNAYIRIVFGLRFTVVIKKV